MKKFEEMKFNIGELKGISARNIEEHLKLYAGYVKNANLIREKIGEYMSDPVGNAFVLGELHRRFSFEFNGVRNHEYYFRSLSGGAKPLPENSTLKSELEKDVSIDKFVEAFKTVAATRGIGWAVLAWDPETEQLVMHWIDEQHLGQLNGTKWILALDMWEHSYIYDYASSEKKKYIDAFFENLNWEVIEENFKKTQK
jgi:Fe-Mn family superoxide dismutase